MKVLAIYLEIKTENMEKQENIWNRHNCRRVNCGQHKNVKCKSLAKKRQN